MNDKFIYALMFDRDNQTNFKQLHDQIVSLDCIKNWFHYIKSSYLLVTDKSTACALDNELNTIFKGKDYLIVAVDLKDSQGWLPDKAWKWIQRQSE